MPSSSALAEQHAGAIQAISQSSTVLVDIHATLQDKYHDIQDSYEDLFKQYDALKKDQTEQRALADRLKCERDTLLDEREKRKAEDEVKIRAAQEAAFAFNAQMSSIAQPDEEIRNKLASLQSQWAVFAREWSSKDISKIFIEGDPEFLKIINQPYIAPSERNANGGLFSKAILPSSGRLLLHAELSHFICWNLIRVPFFSFHGIEADRRAKEGIMDSSALALEGICQEIIHDDPAAGHAWRAQTVALFGLPRDHQHPTSAQRASAKRREDRYEELVDEFDKGRSSCLYRVCSQSDYFKRRTSLKNLLHDTGEYLTRLWMQKVHIDILDLADLCHKPFRIAAEEYEPHNRLKLDVEKKDTKFDGWPIQMVVQPAIVAYGNEQGEGYTKLRKVWSKAIVWVSSGGRLDPARPTEQTPAGSQLPKQAQRPQSPIHYEMATNTNLPIQVPTGDDTSESSMASVKRKPQAPPRRSFDGVPRPNLTQDATPRPPLNSMPTNPEANWDSRSNGQMVPRSYSTVPSSGSRPPTGTSLRGGGNSSKRSKGNQGWFSASMIIGTKSRKQSSASEY